MDVPPEVIDKLVGATLQELRSFSEAGGQVLFGTDVGYMHEYDPTDEYHFMAQAGLSPMQILASLTTAPAERWNESARRGRVAPGLDADLVVLTVDPARDVRNFASVRCAFRAGKPVYHGVDRNKTQCDARPEGRRSSQHARRIPMPRTWRRSVCWHGVIFRSPISIES